jgi:hypothetical protein
MTLLYFHLVDGVDTLVDQDCVEMAPEKIVGRTLVEVRALIADEALRGRIDLRQRIDVKDGEGVVLHSLPFAEAVEIIGPG